MAVGIVGAAVLAFNGFGYAAAQPGDLSTLPVDPNLITDSLAYNAAPAVFNPNGQPGVETVHTHRDGSRTITSNILVLSDAQAATAALEGARGQLAVADGKSQPAAVGSGGAMLTGMSPDGSKSVTVLSFTEGNTATTIEFAGAANDPAPEDLVLELGRKQDTAIRDWQAA
ncbi:hypothetical protein ACGFK1_13895 [Mycobacterium sp. NPDC048908]|uniref:hypothetical protein n=1 Tax=Mycobacterium sp. NPDC048908 TaxID=3364292 RepID=UPI00370FB27D